MRARLTTDASADERQALQQSAKARGLYVQQPGESDDDTLYHAVLLCRQYVERHQAYKPVRVIEPGPRSEAPGAVVVNSEGQIFVATGGNDYDGAEYWAAP